MTVFLAIVYGQFLSHSYQFETRLESMEKCQEFINTAMKSRYTVRAECKEIPDDNN